MRLPPAGATLRTAFSAYIAYVAVIPNALPEGEAKDTFAEFYRRITAVRATGNEGDVKATLATISEDEAVELAKLVVGLEYKISVALGRED